jgi:hypothetical protein
MRMRVCYLDCHEAELCCYLVIHIGNLLRFGDWALCPQAKPSQLGPTDKASPSVRPDNRHVQNLNNYKE